MKLPFSLLLFNVSSGLIISAGVVAIAIGTGAYFANFDWEHPSQLAASFGSMVYMLVSVMVVSVCLIPAWLLATNVSSMALKLKCQPSLLIILCVLAIAIFNFWVGSLALKIGRAELQKKLG